jgi:hypothetical protein
MRRKWLVEYQAKSNIWLGEQLHVRVFSRVPLGHTVSTCYLREKKELIKDTLRQHMPELPGG